MSPARFDYHVPVGQYDLGVYAWLLILLVPPKDTFETCVVQGLAIVPPLGPPVKWRGRGRDDWSPMGGLPGLDESPPGVAGLQRWWLQRDHVLCEHWVPGSITPLGAAGV